MGLFCSGLLDVYEGSFKDSVGRVKTFQLGAA